MNAWSVAQIKSSHAAEMANIRPWVCSPTSQAAESLPPKQRLETASITRCLLEENGLYTVSWKSGDTFQRVFHYKWHRYINTRSSFNNYFRKYSSETSHLIVFNIKIKGAYFIIGSTFLYITTTETIISTLKQVSNTSKASQLFIGKQLNSNMYCNYI